MLASRDRRSDSRFRAQAEQHGLGGETNLGQQCPQLVGHARRQVGPEPGQRADPERQRGDGDQESQRPGETQPDFANRNPRRDPFRKEGVLDLGVEA